MHPLSVKMEIKSKIEEAIKLFERNGAVIENIRLPALKLALPVYYIIACAEASSNLDDMTVSVMVIAHPHTPVLRT